MTLLDFVEDLEAKGVELTVSDDRLRYQGEKSVLTPEILARLNESKGEVIALQQERAVRSTLCPVAYGQSALWFLHQLAPDSSAYNVGFAATIHSRVDSEALRRTLEKLSARHASLRNTFPTRNGAPVQEIHSQAAAAFEVVPATSLTAEERENKVAAAYRAPFNLETGPLLRVHLFTSGEHDHILLLTVHHMICDAWSLWLLLDEWGALYSAECNDTAANLPSVTATYADYVRWQRPFLQGPDGERLWGYWKDSLKGELPVLNLPADHVRPAIQSFKGASFRFRLDPLLTARIRAFASAEGATVYTV